ncbi:MAG TPA: VOC family protein [Allosphingosinicella sp.]|nr:VOC family protein [Allosphingosinicella sp.]
MNLRFQRANFVVRDLDRALTLYRDVLGFEVAFTQGHNPDSYSFPVFEIPPEAKLRFCVLSTGTQERVMALTEITGVDLSPVPHPRRSAIVLEVGDLDSVVAKARAAGARVYDEGELLTKDGRRGREIGIADFDDNLIVIYKILGAQ